MINGILIVLIIGMIVTFSVQNAVSITVSFLIWQIETSFVSVMVAAVLAGVLLTQLLRGLTIKPQASAKKTV